MLVYQGVTSRSLFPNEGSNSFDGFTSTGKVSLDQNYENSALIEQARACAARYILLCILTHWDASFVTFMQNLRERPTCALSFPDII